MVKIHLTSIAYLTSKDSVSRTTVLTPKIKPASLQNTSWSVVVRFWFSTKFLEGTGRLVDVSFMLEWPLRFSQSGIVQYTIGVHGIASTILEWFVTSTRPTIWNLWEVETSISNNISVDEKHDIYDTIVYLKSKDLDTSKNCVTQGVTPDLFLVSKTIYCINNRSLETPIRRLEWDCLCDHPILIDLIAKKL